MNFLRDYVSELAQGSFALAWTAASFVVIETLWPRAGVKVSAASRLKAIVFWSLTGAVANLMSFAIMAAWQSLGVRPLLPSLAPGGLPAPVSVVIGAAAAAFVGDFFYYWCHRAQHRIPILWRFHAVHHSVEELHGLAGYHHVTEGLIEFALYSAPLAFFTASPYAVPLLGAWLAWQGNYEHSPTRLNFGPLGRYFVDNRFHRIHHSADPRHYDKNFGIFTTLWDSVFGTAYFPATDEWPKTGVADFREPATVRDYLLAPFRRRAPLVAPDTALPAEV